MKTCAIVGINWGDEGKGRMVDLLTRDYDIVVRYQGGGNAGHTVINEYGKFALHLLPSGIFRPNVVNILGNGVALDMKSLCGEMESVAAKGVSVTPDNLKISDRASLVLPWHILLDELEEERLKDKKYGSTKQGIAPFYSDKYQKKTIQAGELFYPEYLVRHLEDLLEWKNLTLTRVYGAKPCTMAQLCDYLHTYGQKLKPFICDTGSWLRKAQQDGKSILFEAQLGALRDLDYGIYPYTTSSNAVAAYAPVGSGLPSAKLDEVVGVVKAYSTCVGEGPFTAEAFGEKAEELRKAGGEYGAATGRPRRVGPFDVPASKYGIRVQGATEIALTKLDVLSYLDEIEICTGYELDGTVVTEFPFAQDLDRCKPVLITMEGGSDEFRWSASVGYKNTQGAMRDSERKSLNTSLTLMYKVKNFTFKNQASYGTTKSKESKYGTFSDYVKQQPYNAPYDENGKLVRMFDGFHAHYQGYQNPLYDATLNSFDKSSYRTLTDNFAIEWNPFEGLTLRGQVGITATDNTSDRFLPAEHSTFTDDSQYETDEGFLRRGTYDYTTGRTNEYTGNITLSYTRTFADKHQVYVGLDYSLNESEGYNYAIAAEGFTNEDIHFLASARQYAKDEGPGGSKSKSRRLGLTANVNYIYDNRYFVDFSYRVVL